MKNHSLRVLIAFIAIPPIYFICIAGGIYFFLMVSIISTFALVEFYKLSLSKGAYPMIVIGVIVGFMINASFFFEQLIKFISSHIYDLEWVVLPTLGQLLIMILLPSIIFMSLFELFRNKGSAFLNLSITILGIMYVSLFFGTFIGLRELFQPSAFPIYRFLEQPSVYDYPTILEKIYPWGGYTVFAILAIIWVSDSAAYYVGSAIGQHKLFPRVSPNKSLEGAIAGLIFAIISAIGAKYAVLEYLTILNALVIGIIIGIAGQLGDLVESLFKRDANVKDSSSIIPGHGGVLDRFDSLLLVSPILYLYLGYIVF